MEGKLRTNPRDSVLTAANGFSFGRKERSGINNCESSVLTPRNIAETFVRNIADV